jgi:hypothetical protein
VRPSETRLDPSGSITSGANLVALALAASLATALLLAVAAAVAVRPDDRRAVRAARCLIAGLLVAYLASRTVGIPIFRPEVERADALGVSTKAVEVLALLCALRLGRTLGGPRSPLIQEVAR